MSMRLPACLTVRAMPPNVLAQASSTIGPDAGALEKLEGGGQAGGAGADDDGSASRRGAHEFVRGPVGAARPRREPSSHA